MQSILILSPLSNSPHVVGVESRESSLRAEESEATKLLFPSPSMDFSRLQMATGEASERERNENKFV
jgi:hypothetical protein